MWKVADQAPVAQSDRACAYEAQGHRFDPCPAHLYRWVDGHLLMGDVLVDTGCPVSSLPCDLGGLGKRVGTPIAALLGANRLRRQPWALDCTKPAIHWQAFAPGGEALACRWTPCPVAWLTVNGRTGWMLVDTGAVPCFVPRSWLTGPAIGERAEFYRDPDQPMTWQDTTLPIYRAVVEGVETEACPLPERMVGVCWGLGAEGIVGTEWLRHYQMIGFERDALQLVGIDTARAVAVGSVPAVTTVETETETGRG